MKVFISDLHLGDGSRTDDFHRDQEFIEFLGFVEKEAEELIILGDFLELWQASLDKILFKHSAVINELLKLNSKVKLTYVIGNHDYIPFAKFTGAVPQIRLEYRDPGIGIVAEHGHCYDIFNRYKNPLLSLKWPAGKYVASLAAGLERFVHPDIDLWAKKVVENLDDFLQEAVSVRNKVTPRSKEYLRRGGHFGEFKQAVENHINKGAKIVIFGHTHQPQLEAIDDGIYANCGTWVDESAPTYIVCRRDRIELKQALGHKLIKQIEV